MKLRKCKVLTLAFLIALSSPQPARSQASATLLGRISDAQNAAVAGATIRLAHPVSGFERETVTDARGQFELRNLSFQGYQLSVQRIGFRPARRRVELRSTVPVSVAVRLEVEGHRDSVAVAASAPLALLDPEASGTKTQLSRQWIDKLPLAPGARGLEAVLLTFPGFAANANGTIHPRGAHSQMTYVVDGMPISDQFSGQFATSIDPSLVQSLELFTGDIPAEYGAKVSGVANITTRSGFDGGGRRFGQLELGGGGFDTLAPAVQAGGARGRLGWFGSLSGVKSNRFLDSPSFTNLHNGGNAERGFARLDWHHSPRDLLRLSLLGGRSSFQLANLRSQHRHGQQQRRRLGDAAASLGYVRVLSPAATFESTNSWRATSARLAPSPGDRPVSASLARRLATLTTFNRLNWRRGVHEFRFGVDVQHFPLREDFAFTLTDPSFNDPGRSDFNPNLILYDQTRGGSWFRFQDRRAGCLATGFVQDRIRWRSFVFNLAARFDRYRMLARGSQLQPRVGVAYHLAATGTVLRASFNRNYQTPPNENLLLANSPLSAALAPPEVQRTLNGGVVHISPERQDVVEAGLQQDLGGRAALNAVFYHKDSTNPQDNDNFLNTGIIFPTSLTTARVNGFEARLVVPEARRVSGSLSATHYRATVAPPFTGGLFLGSSALDALGEGPFVIDHDQALGLNGDVTYRPAKGWWTSWQLRHDSGLVSNPSDPEAVAADPDYFDQLPYVDLLGDPPRVRPRTTVAAAVGYERYRGDRRRWELVLQVENLGNAKALYSFQSIFVGTRVIQPRTASLRLRYFW